MTTNLAPSGHTSLSLPQPSDPAARWSDERQHRGLAQSKQFAPALVRVPRHALAWQIMVALALGLATCMTRAASALEGVWSGVRASNGGHTVEYDTRGYPVWTYHGFGVSEPYVRGRSRASYSYANPAGGGFSVSVDVPAATLRSSIEAPPERAAWNPQYGWEYRGGGGESYVVFQDHITVHGPPLAAYQEIPITLRIHLDGTLAPGSSTHEPQYDPAWLEFNAGFWGEGGDTYTNPNVWLLDDDGSNRFKRTVNAGAAPLHLNRVFDLSPQVGRITPGSDLSVWVYASLWTRVGNGGYARFQNTARFELVLPPGYTYTSELGFGTQPPPTAARLDYFRATAATPDAVRLNWGTLVEVRTLGFHVERRAADGAWKRVTTGLIPAEGADQQPHPFQWVDTSAPSVAPLSYRLVEVDLSGQEKVVAEATVTPPPVLAINRAAPGLTLDLRSQPGTVIAIESAADGRGPPVLPRPVGALSAVDSQEAFRGGRGEFLVAVRSAPRVRLEGPRSVRHT